MGLSGMEGESKVDDIVVMTVERLALHLKTEYMIEVAKGLDFMVVLAIFVG